MAINFPDAPTQGQQYTDPTCGVTWIWDGVCWLDAGTAGGGNISVTTDDTPPANPEDGWLWFRTDVGQLYVWYEDGTSGQWVEANTGNSPDLSGYVLKAGDTMTGNLTVPSLNGGQLAGFRNVLINGSLAINQRGVTIAAAAVGAYGPDRWKKVDASNMTQIVESGNFAPGAVYTLSGTGVTTQQLTAPASGNWTLPNIPITATNIQLELGTVATPFERKSIAMEIYLCLRYYQFYRQLNLASWCGTSITDLNWSTAIPPMRTAPTITESAVYKSIDVASVEYTALGISALRMYLIPNGPNRYVNREFDLSLYSEL